MTEPTELLRLLELESAGLAGGGHAFRTRVPRDYVARMEKGNPRDPLFLQVWASGAEDQAVPGFVSDPLHERGTGPGPGVIQKYAGRALLTVTGACAIHCRYCFRRHFPYTDENPLGAQWPATLASLRAIPDLREVILSGGDPLTLPDERLGLVMADLETLPGLRRIRIHTRLPIVLPSRIDAAHCAILSQGLPKVVVVHANHGAEIGPTVRDALGALRATGAQLLNQSVLLAGINDSAPVLCELSERLFEAGVLPYYLHTLDPVAGAAHFQVPAATARALHAALRARLPGYLVPRLVAEIPGEPAKHWLSL